MGEVVDIQVDRYGPFSRISMIRPDPRFPKSPQLSVYRVGDTLIDTGGSLTADALVRFLQNDPPRRILCTHQHEDHVGGVPALRQAFGQLPVFVPADHAPLLMDFDRVPTYRALYWGTPQPITDALPYRAGDVFEVGEVALETHETPGHTPGHIAFVAHADGVAHVLSGDLYTTSPFLAWYESSAPCLLRSCHLLAGLASSVHMLPTHGRVRADGREALERLVAEMEPVCERVAREAPAHAPFPTDCMRYWAIAHALFEPNRDYARVSEGEWSHACFVRSVLDPVRHLPATALPLIG